ncbi:MAG: hypothetical protein CLLPBCKN_000707 [Chroococcidiopsis cubana SAG 39.79]|nr:hypothetical protein [Chroococcidiopsis cubana SAG 39.79]
MVESMGVCSKRFHTLKPYHLAIAYRYIRFSPRTLGFGYFICYLGMHLMYLLYNNAKHRIQARSLALYLYNKQEYKYGTNSCQTRRRNRGAAS